MQDDLGQMEVRFSDTPAGALDLFSQLHKHWTTFPNNLSKIREFLSPRIGSPKFRQVGQVNSNLDDKINMFFF